MQIKKKFWKVESHFKRSRNLGIYRSSGVAGVAFLKPSIDS